MIYANTAVVVVDCRLDEQGIAAASGPETLLSHLF